MICTCCGEDLDEERFASSYNTFTLADGEKVKKYYLRQQCKTCRSKRDKQARLMKFWLQLKQSPLLLTNVSK
jgi:hypothetical protein